MPIRCTRITTRFTERDPYQDRYFSDLKNYHPLTIEEEIECGTIIMKNGKEKEKAIQKLVNANLRFVITVAKQYKTNDVTLADLIEEGNIGLVKAAQSYDPTKGFKFISHAVWWIKQAIFDYLQHNSRQVRIPANRLNGLRKVKEAEENYLMGNGVFPDNNIISEITGIRLSEVEELRKMEQEYVSLDAPVFESDMETKRSDYLEDCNLSTDSDTISKDLQHEISDLLSVVLTDREQRIIRQSFGLGCPEASMEIIRDNEHLSRERVRQLKEQAILKLKKSKYSKVLSKYLG